MKVLIILTAFNGTFKFLTEYNI